MSTHLPHGYMISFWSTCTRQAYTHSVFVSQKESTLEPNIVEVRSVLCNDLMLFLYQYFVYEQKIIIIITNDHLLIDNVWDGGAPLCGCCEAAGLA